MLKKYEAFERCVLRKHREGGGELRFYRDSTKSMERLRCHLLNHSGGRFKNSPLSGVPIKTSVSDEHLAVHVG